MKKLLNGTAQAFSHALICAVLEYAADAYVAVQDRNVSPDEGVSPQLTPIREDPDVGEETPTYVNWGSYQSSWLVIGAGVTADF